MFFKYLGRELTKRRKQSALIATGMGLAIALVVLVSSVAGGLKAAQQQALSNLYGIGTDIAVTKSNAPAADGKGQKFNIGASDGNTSGSSRTFSKSMLRTQPFTGTLTQDEVDQISQVSGVTAVVATLKLESTTFNGQLPDFVINMQNRGSLRPGQNNTQNNTQSNPKPTGGSDGAGGSAFDITRFSVEGVSVDNNNVGPLASVTVNDGRNFGADDASAYVALVDTNYASSNSLAVGDKITLASKKFEIVGIVTSSATSGSNSTNVYIPIALAQKLSSDDGTYSNLYIAADSSQNLADIKTAILKISSDATVSTSEDLASTVSGSLTTASDLVKNMGGWLSFIVLLAAFASSILFTTSGVNRRVREFGTLKAIGWRSSRVTLQIMGEALAGALIGGVVGIALGYAGVAAVNAFAPALTATMNQGGFPGFGGPGGNMRPGTTDAAGGAAATDANAMSLALHSTVDLNVILLAIGISILGGLLAGIFGGIRATRLSPASALKSLE